MSRRLPEPEIGDPVEIDRCPVCDVAVVQAWACGNDFIEYACGNGHAGLLPREVKGVENGKVRHGSDAGGILDHAGGGGQDRDE